MGKWEHEGSGCQVEGGKGVESSGRDILVEKDIVGLARNLVPGILPRVYKKDTAKISGKSEEGA